MSEWGEGNLEFNNVKAKIQKLLRLSQSDNIHEAASACAKAQTLMTQYSITESMVYEGQEEEPYEATLKDVSRHVLYWTTGTTIATWMVELNWGICAMNQCKGSFVAGSRRNKTKGRLVAYGTDEDVAIASTMLFHLMEEVEKLYKKKKPSGLGRGGGRTWAHSFRLGCVAEVVKRLREAKKRARKNLARDLLYQKALADGDGETLLALDAGEEPEAMSHSLVRVDNAVALLKKREVLVDVWCEENAGLRSVVRPGASNVSAYDQGRMAGKTANLNAARRKRLES